MALPNFAYCRPQTVDEALALLREHGHGAKILAGGQTLLPLLNMRLVQPDVVIDLAGIDSLRGITAVEAGVRIGAMTRHREIELSSLLAERCPLMSAAAAQIGHSHIRHRGTVGGSVAHADPAAEYPVALLALEAQIEITGPEGRRMIPADGFFLGPLVTALGQGEMVTAIHIPELNPDFGWAFEEMTIRAGEFAAVCVAALLRVQDGRISEVRVAIGGATESAARLEAAEAALVGAAPGPEVWHRAGQAASAEVDAVDDPAMSAAYRRALTAVYTEKCLRGAAKRWEG